MHPALSNLLAWCDEIGYCARYICLTKQNLSYTSVRYVFPTKRTGMEKEVSVLAEYLHIQGGMTDYQVSSIKTVKVSSSMKLGLSVIPP